LATVAGLVVALGLSSMLVRSATTDGETSSWLGDRVDGLRALVSFAPERSPGAARSANAAPNSVTVSKPVVRETIDWDDYTARFDALDTVDMRARIAGYLQQVHFKDGQYVNRGDLLFTIDPRPFERALDQARAELAQARTKVENTSRDVDRGIPLVERKIMSEKVFDDRANLKRDAEAALKVAEAKVRTAELDLEFTRIVAPIAGRISRSMISAGNFVVAGSTSNPTLLATIVSLDPMNLYFDVSEANALKYRRLAQAGQKAGVSEDGTEIQLALPDETGFPHRGKIDYSDIRLDPGTSTLRARAVVDNPGGLFTTGMFARVRLKGSSPYEALLIPDEAIGSDQANRFLWVVAEDGTATRRVVTLGPVVSGLRAIRTGITADEWVIVKGIQRARQGQKVTVTRDTIKLSEVPARTGSPVSAEAQ
jgi:multidrug efflux system membrane fusion protein